MKIRCIPPEAPDGFSPAAVGARLEPVPRSLRPLRRTRCVSTTRKKAPAFSATYKRLFPQPLSSQFFTNAYGCFPQEASGEECFLIASRRESELSLAAASHPIRHLPYNQHLQKTGEGYLRSPLAAGPFDFQLSTVDFLPLETPTLNGASLSMYAQAARKKGPAAREPRYSPCAAS